MKQDEMFPQEERKIFNNNDGFKAEFSSYGTLVKKYGDEKHTFHKFTITTTAFGTADLRDISPVIAGYWSTMEHVGFTDIVFSGDKAPKEKFSILFNPTAEQLHLFDEAVKERVFKDAKIDKFIITNKQNIPCIKMSILSPLDLGNGSLIQEVLGEIVQVFFAIPEKEDE